MQNNNYPNWLVPLEIAKKIKEIGFDEPCAFYTRIPLKEKTSIDKIPYVSNDCYSKLKGVKNSEHINDDITYGLSIPTWEQAFEWFRKKDMFHSIHISEDLLHKVKFFEAEIRDKNADIICIISKLTYEKARKALINKLIEVYKKE